jgi:hypothetical protein
MRSYTALFEEAEGKLDGFAGVELNAESSGSTLLTTSAANRGRRCTRTRQYQRSARE